LLHQGGAIAFTVPIAKVIEMRDLLDNVIAAARPN
jgi:hypothetical protein